MDAARKMGSTTFEQIRFVRDVVRQEGEALVELSQRVGEEVCQAAELMLQASGTVVVTGMGKAGHIGRKLAATLASTGTRSQYLHPAEAVHGDLGCIQAQDVVLALSWSGETEELVRILPAIRISGAPLIAITGRPASPLAQTARVVLDLGTLREACPLGLAPTTSTTAMLALGDGLALLCSRLRGFRADDFARFHPAGNLGRKLARVEEVMRPLAECRVGRDDQTVRETLVRLGRPGRRTGAIMLTDDAGRLTGIFTDSDLARLLERKMDASLDRPMEQVMTRQPVASACGAPIAEAVELLVARRISELPVTDAAGCPVGLLDITDVVGLLPRGEPSPLTLPAVSEPTPQDRGGKFPHLAEETWP